MSFTWNHWGKADAAAGLKEGSFEVKLVVFAALALLVVAIAAFAQLIVPYDPYAQDLSLALQAPSWEHPAGTDRYGRDTLSRIIMGAQSSVFSTLALVVVVAAVGLCVGVVAGWRGGAVDTVLMRASDVFLAFPGLVFALAVAGTLGGGMHNAVIALAAISWPKYARIARGLTLAVKGEPYLAAARLAGCGPFKLIVRHVMPNIIGPVLVTAVLDIGTMIMELAGLSFLGLGAQPPLAEWGSMMSDNRALLQTAPWTIIGPGVAIFIVVAVFNLLGDTLRDWFDSSQRASTHAHVKSKSENRRSRRAVAIAAAGVVVLVVAIGAPAFILSGSGQAGVDNAGEKTFVYGTTGYGVEMDDAGLNPHHAYSGWSAVRYGVGETLFRFSDAMEPEPWLATGYEFVSDTRCVITLRDGVTFTSGRVMDGQAVKECLDDLVSTHERAAADLKISRIVADGNTVVIETIEPCPGLINYLCDPYGAIIDMQAGVTEDANVSGTGPYRATSVSDTEISLVKNESYWGGTPKLDSIIVRSITDGDTLTAALQSGEIDAAYGMPYASYELFSDESAYSIESCDTSRSFFGQVNCASPIMGDEAVREAISLGIDRQGFISTLLNGRGVAASGPFTEGMAFGDGAIRAVSYDPERAKQILDEAGWVDEDGDGVREKEGHELTVRWLTYPGRMELPLLAESAQATLGEIGFDIQVNSTANHTEIRKDLGAWDVYVSALVTAPTGDPEYFFSATCVTGAAANYGCYSNAELDALANALGTAFDPAERARIAVDMQELILDDGSYFFASHLTMGIVSKANVTGIEPHPCDYYEITVDLDVA